MSEIEARGSDLLVLVLYIMQAWRKMAYIEVSSLFEDYVFSLGS